MFKVPWEDERRFTGLEIGSGYVKLAQGQYFKGSRKIVKLIVKKLASHSEEDIIKVLKTIVAELKGHLEHLAICIPRHKVTVRFLRFPTLNEKEIAGMVRLQSAKELPFAKEEIVSNYLVTERTKDGYAKVALVIVHLDVIRGYLDVLQKAGIEPERATFSSEAVRAWQAAVFSRGKLSQPFLLIDLDSDNTDIIIFANSHLAFTRGLGLGVTQLQERPDLKNKLAEEIKRTLASYAEAKKVSKIFFVQPNETIEGLKAFLEQSLNLPCEVLAPLNNLTCQKEVSFQQKSLGPSLLRVLGMALDTREHKLNLLPLPLRKKQEFKWRRKRLYKTVMLFLGIVLLGLLIFAKKIYEQQLRIFYLDREIEKTAPFAMNAESMLKKIELIENRRRVERSVVDVLRQLHSITPGSISLSNFSYAEYGDEDSIVILQGVSTSMSEIFTFINTLEQSAYFKNVQLIYVSGKRAKVGAATDFKIECTVEE